MLKKPWSITTTTRSPYRLRAQLRVLNDDFVGHKWTKESQINFQILLIQHRLYGYTEEGGFSSQFLLDLSEEHRDIFSNFQHGLTFEEAKAIFESKNYVDPPLRGRQSLNPFKKFGFVYLHNKVLKISRLGEHFLANDYDLSEIFFRIFLKWQLPNPVTQGYTSQGGYDIKPFIATLHLIKNVNLKWEDLGNSPVGISKKEFILFVPTLINFSNIEIQVQKIIDLRVQQQGKTTKEKSEILEKSQQDFAADFLGSNNPKKIKKLLNNLKDYGDNAIRYFRLTQYIHIRGNGYYVDLENRRTVEIETLLADDNGQSKPFESKSKYLDYISDISEPQFPWETLDKCIEIAQKLVNEIKAYETTLQKDNIQIGNYQSMKNDELIEYIKQLRKSRRQLQDEADNIESQSSMEISSYIQKLKNIFTLDDRPIMLEKLSGLGLRALNDAQSIRPNYPVGDDNEPTFTAPANVPDIECFYKNFNAICEVTMLKTRAQWYNEGQPVMRHLRDFEKKYPNKPSYCLFIAPGIHRDTINTFWSAVKYEYEGQPQKIIPLTINHFISILEILLELKAEAKLLDHTEIVRLYDEILNSVKSSENSNEWLKSIPTTISSWKQSLIP